MPIGLQDTSPHYFSRTRMLSPALDAAFLEFGSPRTFSLPSRAASLLRAFSSRKETVGELAACSSRFPCLWFHFWCIVSLVWCSPASYTAAVMAPPRRRSHPASCRPRSRPGAPPRRLIEILWLRKEDTASLQFLLKRPPVFEKSTRGPWRLGGLTVSRSEDVFSSV